MNTRRRGLVVLIVLDGVGIGELPDAGDFGDRGSHTLGNLAASLGGLYLPHLEMAGLGNIESIEGIGRRSSTTAFFGKMAERSPGKDSTSGHWELMGCLMDRPFPLFPHGFPDEVIQRFVRLTGRGVLGNRPASGTAIIEELGPEHLRTGKLIVYTSADSVFQVAAHREVVALEELYEACRNAREILRGEYEVARVIARPFEGMPGAFVRVPGRKDFSVSPPQRTVLDSLLDRGFEVWGVGKVDELFGGRGFSRILHTRDNRDGVDRTLSSMDEMGDGLVFTNLVEFDSRWGHRNDAPGFAGGLRVFDEALPRLVERVEDRGLLILTADHGCDPTTPSTDHSREYVPLLVFDGWGDGGGSLGTRRSLADVGSTVARFFGVPEPPVGEDFAVFLPSFQVPVQESPER